ncbi:quinone oxidoreductase-like [Mercenaria mercenaria]|uniref:quinone oxidoreductase-like n=1 Tax=Mercenaria mercenaria TaxID=6596 RepID=UPI00234EB7E1|nr:quinone oxidoreductase-like [Mercenaria mercenaria]
MAMRAIRVKQFGGPEVLQLEESVAVPIPSDTQVLVQVRAAGINPVDTYIRSGTYQMTNLPYTPGRDGAGIIKKVGSKTTKFKPGDRVYFLFNASGSYAQYVAVEEGMVGHLADYLTLEQGAAIGIPYYTAFRALSIKARDKFKAGNTVLVHGASGAVGLASVQFAVSRGLTVYGTAGSQEGIHLVLEHGATAVYNHRDEGYIDKMKAAMNGSGPDIIVEMLANVNLATDMTLVNRNGIIVVVGCRGNVEVNPRLAMQKEFIVTGFALPNAAQGEWTEMHELMAEGMQQQWVQPHISKIYPMHEATQAHENIIKTKAALGKIILKVEN